MSGQSRLRVLVVSLGRRGGVTEYGWLMGRALDTMCDVGVVYSSFAENAWKWGDLDAPTLGIPTFRGIVGLLISFAAVGRLVRIRRFARAFGPDVIYYPGGHAWKPLLDILLPRSAATVLTVHDPELHEGEQSLAWRALGWLNRRRISGYVLLNQFQRDAFVARNGLRESQVTVIPLGAFDDYTRPGDIVPDVPEIVPLGVQGEGDYVLFLGRLLPYKGIDVLLDAYAGLDDDQAGPLVIAGSGALSARERDQLGALGARPVYLVNRWLSDAEVASLVDSARFVVLPYRSATQSGLIPLALARGVPALAAASAGLTEQVVTGQTGFLFPPGDAPALRALLRTAYSMGASEYARMSDVCRAYAREHWSWETLAAQLREFAESHVGRMHEAAGNER